MAKIDALRIDDTTENNSPEFVQVFLNSVDFDHNLRKSIARSLNLQVGEASGTADIVRVIMRAYNADQVAAVSAIADQLVNRKSPLFAIRVGTVKKFPDLNDLEELVHSRGSERWYGPVVRLDDVESHWYIRPKFIGYEEDNSHEDVSSVLRMTVRVLFCARVTNETISLHWRNFTSGDGRFKLDDAAPARSGQFPYWKYVPSIFEEIIGLCNAQVQDIRFEGLIFERLWEKYRYNYEEYEWIDMRIRAEHRGVALNATAGVPSFVPEEIYDENEEFDDSDESKITVTGIRYLAETIRSAVFRRLGAIDIGFKQNQYSHEIERGIDDEILRTLIRNYNPKSYEFLLRSKLENRKLMRTHIYFAKRAQSDTPDKFIHGRLYDTHKLGDIRQIQLLLDHLRDEDLIDNNPTHSGQLSLF